MNVKLVMYLKGVRQRDIALKQAETVIGRQKGCALRIASHEISRLHCCVRAHDGKVTVRDLGSANGTFVNNQQIKGEQLLKHGDKLQLADLTFVVEYEQGQEVLAGLPVEEFEFVDDIVEGVIVLEDEPKKQRPKVDLPKTIEMKSLPLPPARKPNSAPVLPPGLEEVFDALPAAEVEESITKAAASASLPMAEVEQSAPPVAPQLPVSPLADEAVPFAEPESADEEEPWVPPWEEKPEAESGKSNP
jgi:predicted component of type VI protein secretion system